MMLRQVVLARWSDIGLSVTSESRSGGPSQLLLADVDLGRMDLAMRSWICYPGEVILDQVVLDWDSALLP